MSHSNHEVAAAQIAAAVAGVVVIAVTVPIFGLVMLPVVALAAAARGLANVTNVVGTAKLLE